MTLFVPRDNRVWRDYFHGRCVVLCSGPDLPDVHRLDRIDYPIIGVNKSYLRKQPDIWVTCDLHLKELNDKGAFDAEKEIPNAWLRFSTYSMKGCTRVPYMDYTEAKRRNRYICEIEPDDCVVRWCSPPVAFQIGVWLGFTEFIFLGMPLHGRRGFHFYPMDEFDNKQWLKREEDVPKMIAMQREYWWRAKPEIEERGLRLINCSLDAAEDVSEKIPFDEVF